MSGGDVFLTRRQADEAAETEKALHVVMDERNDALRRIDAVLELHAPIRAYPEPRFQARCRACSTGQVSHFDDGSYTHGVVWPCATVLALAPATTRVDMEAVLPAQDGGQADG